MFGVTLVRFVCVNVFCRYVPPAQASMKGGKLFFLFYFLKMFSNQCLHGLYIEFGNATLPCKNNTIISRGFR